MPALDLDTLNATLAECGCCEHPSCCPPQIECQSGFGRGESVGFIDPGSDDDRSDSGALGIDWKQTRYLRKVFVETGGGDYTNVEDYPGGSSGSFTSQTLAVTWVKRFIEEYSQAFEASVSGAAGLGFCGISEPEFETRCEYSGGWVSEIFEPYFADGVWSNFLSQRVTGTISDASGEETAEHIEWEIEAVAWDLAHPDYPAEVAAYEAAHSAWQADYDAWEVTYLAWQEDWNEWDAGGQIGPEPEEPAPFEDPEPTLAAPRPEEPGEFYPECTMKTTTVTTAWERVGGVVQLVEDTEEDPNPRTDISIPGFVEGITESSALEYEEPVTFEAWLALVEAWLATNSNFDHAEDSGFDSQACPPGNGCTATKIIGRGIDEWQSAIETDFFRFRIKLNKCCAWPAIRSEWSRVMFPQAWLEWLAEVEAATGSDPLPTEPATKPVKTPQVWTWSGVPPRCEDSTSGSDSVPLNPYDHEPMWSPWSLVIALPDGMEGRIANRNYYQKCYAAPPQRMPEIFGIYEPDSESV
jgi:hypothetical protein